MGFSVSGLGGELGKLGGSCSSLEDSSLSRITQLLLNHEPPTPKGFRVYEVQLQFRGCGSKPLTLDTPEP